MKEYPIGTLTFLLTDIESSTDLWDRFPEAMRVALARHDEIIEGIVDANRGMVIRPRGEGDSRFAVFSQADDGVHAAVAILKKLDSGFADLPFALKARIGIHTGTADLRMGDYYGSTVNRCARIRSLGHGGQALLSQVTAEITRDALPEGVSLNDLGTHPLKGLSREEKIYQLWIPSLPNQFPPLKSLESIEINLPIPPTNFVGRQRDVAEVQNLLLRADVRLVTLTGMGGTGKTRLSLEVGRAILKRFPQGLVFIDLSPISDPALVAATVAHSLGIREGGDRPLVDNLIDYLADKEMLAIFDNFEQVTAAAPVVAELLAAAPRLKTLATSRIALQIRGEHEYSVAPLGLPSDATPLSVEQTLGFEAIRLFVQQARAVQPNFELTQDNAVTVAEICRRLDGLPLAIEIAAARIKMLPPQAILKRLDKSLKLLVGGAVDLPTRHQTLRSAIDWSYNLLKAEEQRLFARLSVFVGGFSLESAEIVCSSEGDLDVFSGVEALLKASLLNRVESAAGEARFALLQTIREYALEKLEASGDLAELRRAHAEHYAKKAAEMGPHIYGRQAVEWLARFEEEHANFRAAMTWGLESETDIQLAAEMVFHLGWFWYRYGHFHEGREWCERVVAATEKMGASPLLAAALSATASLAMWQGDLHNADRRAVESLRMVENSGDENALAWVRFIYGAVLINQGRDREAYSQLAQAVEPLDQTGMFWIEGSSLIHMANAALGLGQFDEAKARLDQALPIVTKVGDPWQIAFCLINYGELARAQGDYDKAREYYLRTETTYREADALGDLARLIHTFGYLAQHRGEYEQARTQFKGSLDRFRALGNRRGIAECLAGLAGIAAEQNQPRWAAQLLSAAHALLIGFGGAWWPADRVEIDRALARLKTSLTKAVFDPLWEAGQTMSMTEAISFAMQGVESENPIK